MDAKYPVARVSIADGENQPVANLLIRPGTADERTVQGVMARRQYDISHLNRRDELLQIYKKMRGGGKIPLIVDLGANIGASALYFNHVWPGSQIIAVEPEPENFSLLVENTKEQKTILPVAGAISSTDGRVGLIRTGMETDAYRTISGHDITAFSMASILAMASGEPFICKIDIEGAERELFSANTDWIDLFPLIVIELHDWMLCGEAASQNFLRSISNRRRDFTFYGDTVFSIRC